MHHSPLGIVWTAVTAAVMFALAFGSARTGAALDNPILKTEGRVTVIDGLLATAVLLGRVLNLAFGWWWADPAASYVLVYYALREIFAPLPQPRAGNSPAARVQPATRSTKRKIPSATSASAAMRSAFSRQRSPMRTERYTELGGEERLDGDSDDDLGDGQQDQAQAETDRELIKADARPQPDHGEAAGVGARFATSRRTVGQLPLR